MLTIAKVMKPFPEHELQAGDHLIIWTDQPMPRANVDRRLPQAATIPEGWTYEHILRRETNPDTALSLVDENQESFEVLSDLRKDA